MNLRTYYKSSAKPFRKEHQFHPSSREEESNVLQTKRISSARTSVAGPSTKYEGRSGYDSYCSK